MTALTVVIPTYNRCQTLEKSISAYLQQTALEAICEIIVVDDGSTDDTATQVSQLSINSVIPIRYFRQENQGPAAARNVGIREATSELILFTDDDIVPSPTLVAEHLDWHRKFPDAAVAVLGYVTWAPEVSPTPFMKWYGSDFLLFAYAHFTGRTELNYEYFYSCNLSLKVEFLRRNGTFDEEFKTAAWEDIELGYRLSKVGMRLLYNPDALAYHHQHVSFDDACRRYRKSEAAGQVFRRKEAGRGLPFHEMSRFKRNLKQQIAGILSPFKSFMDCRLPLPWGMYRAMFRIFR